MPLERLNPLEFAYLFCTQRDTLKVNDDLVQGWLLAVFPTQFVMGCFYEYLVKVLILFVELLLLAVHSIQKILEIG